MKFFQDFTYVFRKRGGEGEYKGGKHLCEKQQLVASPTP